MSKLWKALPCGFAKEDWDAAVDKLNWRMRMGITVRDHEGWV